MQPIHTTAEARKPGALKIAFYAPLKPPDHDVPSGDRQMARALVLALQSLGHKVVIASALRAWSASPDADRLAELRSAGARERARLLRDYQDSEMRPDLWLTYHPYYKSPDFIGPRMAAALAIPYVAIEAAHAAKRAQGVWSAWQAETEAAIRAAALHFCMTERDRDGLAAFLGPQARLTMLPPFIIAMPGLERTPRAQIANDPVRLISIGMMRPGTKLASYTFLAKALPLIAGLNWHLTIVGDGPLRAQIEALFADTPSGRITWIRGRDVHEIPHLLAQADIHVWPGCDEAYGLSYLDAQAVGLPVVALDSGGVAEVVCAGVTGLLSNDNSLADYAAALAQMIGDADMRSRMGAAARRFVEAERTLAPAAARLQAGLHAVMAAHGGASQQ